MGRTILLALGAVVIGIAASPAYAAPGPVITGSSISTPADGTELFFDGDSGAGSVTVRGTVAGGGPGSRGDLRCYSSADTSSTRLAADVDLSSGTFALVVSLSSIAGEACRLRMVPAGFAPTGAAAAPFAGPALSISDMYSHSSTGNVYGYYILSGTLQWSFAFQSLGECPVTASYETSTPQLGSLQLFAGGACLPELSGIAPNFRSRSAIQIDGLNAYPPAAIAPQPNTANPNLTSVAGFVPLQYSAAFDANHDTVTINEAETAMVCNPAEAFPPTVATCPGLSDSGIHIAQTTTLLPGGQVARVSERFQNADSRPHTVDLLSGNAVVAPGPGLEPGFEFPGQSSFAAHAEPDSFNQFGSGPASIIVIGNVLAAPSSSNPIGAITYSAPPASADFLSSAGSQTAAFTLRYHTTLAPGRSVTYSWSYSQSANGLDLLLRAQGERDRFFAPRVSISHPRRHLVTRDPHLRVAGRVSDRVGIRSVTVNGIAARLGRHGTYSATIALAPGNHVITAIATNLGGNQARASRSVTYQAKPCVVPALRGLKLAKARADLRRADCRPGRVIRKRSRKVRRGRVIASSPGAGAHGRPLARVRLYISRGR